MRKVKPRLKHDLMLIGLGEITKQTCPVKGGSRQTVGVAGDPPRFKLGCKRTVGGPGGPIGSTLGLIGYWA